MFSEVSSNTAEVNEPLEIPAAHVFFKLCREELLSHFKTGAIDHSATLPKLTFLVFSAHFPFCSSTIYYRHTVGGSKVAPGGCNHWERITPTL
jgi:hypothetical protein